MKSVRSKFCLLLIAGLFLRTFMAFAQDPTPALAEQAGATAEVERIIVTGSHIPTTEEVGANPVLTIDRALIDKSGERTAEELIRNLTVAGPQGIPTSNNPVGSTIGAASISLRGFEESAITLGIRQRLRESVLVIGALRGFLLSENEDPLRMRPPPPATSSRPALRPWPFLRERRAQR